MIDQQLKEDLQYAQYIRDDAMKQHLKEAEKARAQRERRLDNQSFVVKQMEQPKQVQPQLTRMTREELKLNKQILKTVKDEKRKGALDNIYEVTALPNITTLTH